MSKREKGYANLRPIKPGEVRNPLGSSAKQRRKMSERRRLEELRAQIFGPGGEPERVTGELLVDAMNADTTSLTTFLKNDFVPVFARVVIKEAMTNPDFALKLYNTLCGQKRVEVSGKNGAPLNPSPVVIQVDTEEDAENFAKLTGK